jgi:hypothetical protein
VLHPYGDKREGFPLVTYLGLQYLRRPALARGELRVDWDPAELSRNAWWPGERGRALRIRAKGRPYTYTERGGKCGHELKRAGAGVPHDAFQLEEPPNHFRDLLR